MTEFGLSAPVRRSPPPKKQEQTEGDNDGDKEGEEGKEEVMASTPPPESRDPGVAEETAATVDEESLVAESVVDEAGDGLIEEDSHLQQLQQAIEEAAHEPEHTIRATRRQQPRSVRNTKGELEVCTCILSG